MMQSSVIALSTNRFTRWSACGLALLVLSVSGCYAPYGGYPPYGGYGYGAPGAPIQTLQPGVQPYIPGNGGYPGSTYPSTIPSQPGSTPTYDNGGNGTLQPIPNNDPGYGGGNVKVPDPYSPAPNASSSLYPTESGIQPANHSEPSGLQPLDPYPGSLNEVRSQNPTATAEASGMSSQAKPTQTFQPPIQAEPGFGNQPTVATPQPQTPRIEAEPTYQPIPIAQPNPMAEPVNSTPIPTQPFPEPTPVAQPAPIQQPMPTSQPVASPFGQPIPVAQPLPMGQPPIESPFGQPTPTPVAQPAPIASPFNAEPTPAPAQPSQAPANSEFANPFEPSAEFQPPREAEIPAPPLNND